MTPVITLAMVLIVDELVRPGDLEAGDVIALPDEAAGFWSAWSAWDREGSSSGFRLQTVLSPGPSIMSR
jgi:hypothetical protein